ncbi:hypothetical protein D9619_003715 [Psilocybe cf. subviscida]|uniref:Protein ZIP4 homolog n=1 Tax=Psilocybe cf. subviscida TaxID=2480587 RepID=A0A8H5AX15_9AGAR|nr:hypothetical protein D9619_003715 [Psilocybe cf. subviscida]
MEKKVFTTANHSDTVSRSSASRWSRSVTLSGSLFSPNSVYSFLINSSFPLIHFYAMSARKKTGKTGSDKLSGLHTSILERISRVKPLLEDPNHTSRTSVVEDLTQVASLAERFTESRSNASKASWSHLADSLDREGVNLWNISALVQKSLEGSDALIAALRLAAFRLVEAGLESKPGTETLLHVLQLASKAGAALCGVCSTADPIISSYLTRFLRLADIGNTVTASSVLTSAAKVEEHIKKVDDSDDTQQRAIACATVMYQSTRMDAAWKEGNRQLADYMSQKITGKHGLPWSPNDTQRLSFIPMHAREALAYKHAQIGRSFLLKGANEQEGSKAADAVVWLQRAFAIADQLEDKTDSAIGELKISILRTMVLPIARAYFMSEEFERAEGVLDELIPTVDASKDCATAEYQELRWLRLAVMKRRKAGNSSLIDAFNSIIDHMEFTEANITDILQDLKTLSHHHTLVTAVHRNCLERALRRHAIEPDHIHRLLLSLIIHLSKDEDHARAMETMESVFTMVNEADIELPSIPTTACLTLIWQYGSRHYKEKKWQEAADWYMAGSHVLFRKHSPSSMTKCLRKAALCHIEHKSYALASTVIRRCTANEAATHYVAFLTALHQGLENEAIRAIHDMTNAPDFDRQMLLLVTQLSHQSDMKPVLLAVLESLLKTLKIGSNGDVVIEAMALIRCIIRLVHSLLQEPTSSKPALIDIVVNHFRTARILTDAASAVPLVFKDISWLWRVAYNCAVEGTSQWVNAGDQIAELFDIARELLEVCCQASPIDLDADLCIHLANASFAAVSGRVFSAREIITSTGTIDETLLRNVASEIKQAKARIIKILEKRVVKESHDHERIQYFVYALRIFHSELLAQLREWDQLSVEVDDVVGSGPLAVGTYEAIADILWIDTSCPVNVLQKCLEAVLRASLSHESLSVEKFSRWLRAICTINIARDTPEDRFKAIGYVEHALSVMEDHSDGDEYPMDERQWLLATSYNTATECLHASMFDEAKRWFEAATVICRFVPEGRQRAEKASIGS